MTDRGPPALGNLKVGDATKNRLTAPGHVVPRMPRLLLPLRGVLLTHEHPGSNQMDPID